MFALSRSSLLIIILSVVMLSGVVSGSQNHRKCDERTILWIFGFATHLITTPMRG
jgi:hypothetical protein